MMCITVYGCALLALSVGFDVYDTLLLFTRMYIYLHIYTHLFTAYILYYYCLIFIYCCYIHTSQLICYISLVT